MIYLFNIVPLLILILHQYLFLILSLAFLILSQYLIIIIISVTAVKIAFFLWDVVRLNYMYMRPSRTFYYGCFVLCFILFWSTKYSTQSKTYYFILKREIILWALIEPNKFIEKMEVKYENKLNNILQF